MKTRFCHLWFMVPAGVLMASMNAHAGGILTFDALNDIANTEMLSTAANTYEQTADAARNTYNTYEQTLQQYNQTLRQMEGLKRRVDAGDYVGLLDKLSRQIDRYPGNDDSLYTSDEWRSMENQVDDVFKPAGVGGVEDWKEMINGGKYDRRSGSSVFADAKRAYNKKAMGTSQQIEVKDNTAQLQSQLRDIQSVNETRMALGDNDQLRTLQAMSDQQQVQLDVLQNIATTANTQLRYSNLLDNEVMSSRANSLRAMDQARINAQNASYAVDNTSMVNY